MNTTHETTTTDRFRARRTVAALALAGSALVVPVAATAGFGTSPGAPQAGVGTSPSSTPSAMSLNHNETLLRPRG